MKEVAKQLWTFLQKDSPLATVVAALFIAFFILFVFIAGSYVFIAWRDESLFVCGLIFVCTLFSFLMDDDF